MYKIKTFIEVNNDKTCHSVSIHAAMTRQSCFFQQLSLKNRSIQKTILK